MRLRARCPCSVRLAAVDLRVQFAAGEELRTEISAKFTRERLAADLTACDLRLEGWLTDPGERFAVSLSAPARPFLASRRRVGIATLGRCPPVP